MGIESGTAARQVRGGQALAEFAVCLGAVVLVVCGLLAFADCILAGLDIERDLRSKSGTGAMGITGANVYSSRADVRTVEIPKAAAEVIFGGRNARLGESVHIPAMKIENGAAATMQGMDQGI